MGPQIQGAQYIYIYWTHIDTSCRRDESRGAAGRPGSDWTTGRSGAHAPGMAQGSSSWDYLQIQATQGVYVYFYWTIFPTCDHFSGPPYELSRTRIMIYAPTSQP